MAGTASEAGVQEVNQMPSHLFAPSDMIFTESAINQAGKLERKKRFEKGELIFF